MFRYGTGCALENGLTGLFECMDTATASPSAGTDQTSRKTAAASGSIDVRLIEIKPVARDINLYTFGRTDGGSLPDYEPGAHIDMHLPNGLIRQFSLVVPARYPKTYVIGVKRDPASRGGSRYIFDEMNVGDEIKIGVPRNNFPLNEDALHVSFFAGGIGITPIWCMVQRLAALGRSWTLYYACRSRTDMAFFERLQGFDSKSVRLHFDDEAGGKTFDLAAAINETARNAHLYCCGPNPMVKAFEAATTSWPRNHVHIEYFTPQADAAAKAGGFWVELARSGRKYFVPEGSTILDVLCEAGVNVDYSCRLGICGACEQRVIAGTPEHHDSILNEEERAANNRVMICCAGCKGERLVLDL